MQELTFKFSIDEANLILGSLAKGSFETVNGLIGKIKDQANEQLQPKVEAPSEEVKPLKKSK